MMAKFLLSGFADEIDTKLDVQVKELKGLELTLLRLESMVNLLWVIRRRDEGFKKLFDDGE